MSEVRCIKCHKPVQWGTGYGLRKTYCRKCFEKKANRHYGGDFYAALMAIWEENLAK